MSILFGLAMYHQKSCLSCLFWPQVIRNRVYPFFLQLIIGNHVYSCHGLSEIMSILARKQKLVVRETRHRMYNRIERIGSSISL